MRKYLLLILLFSVPMILVDASHREPFQVTYTITEYLSFSTASKAIQEAAVHNAVTAWAEHLNAEVVFVPNAEKKDVFCWIAFTQLSELGGGAGRAGFFCQAEVSRNAVPLYFSNHQPKPTGDNKMWKDAEVTLQHELGHGFGLGHYGLGSCQMFASYGGSPDRHCPQELDRLQQLWANVEPWPPVRTYDGAMKSFSGPSTAIPGETIRLDWTIENVGTFFYYSTVWFHDFTDRKNIQTGPWYELDSGETFSSSTFYTIKDNAIIGEHWIRGCWIASNPSDPENAHLIDIDWDNNCIDLFINVTSIAQPPPPPEPEPPQFTTSILDSVTTLNQTSIFIEWHNEVTPDGGFDLFINNVDTNLEWRTNNLFQTVTELQPDTQYCIKVQNRYITPIRTFPLSNELCTITDPIPPPPPPPPEPDPINHIVNFSETSTITDKITVTHIIGEVPLPTFEQLVEMVRELQKFHE